MLHLQLYLFIVKQKLIKYFIRLSQDFFSFVDFILIITSNSLLICVETVHEISVASATTKIHTHRSVRLWLDTRALEIVRI